MLTSLIILATLVSSQSGSSTKPNIIYIMADDLGYTDPACYGSKYYETPNIDAMASQGIRFLQGYSCGPNCQPTRAALMSGQYGARTGVYTVGGINRFDWQSRPLKPVENVEELPLKKITIADSLKSNGYTTALFGKWHLGQQGDHHPSKRGFDEAIVSMGKHFDFVTTPKIGYPKGIYLADFLTNKAVHFINQNKDKPFFLCVHHFGVHSPYEAKKELIDRFQKKQGVGGHNNPTYAAMLFSVDESVGRILKTLDELNLSKNTLVIFTSDNGGVGGYVREGIRQGGDKTDNTPLRGGKGMLYEGGVRSPLVVWGPGFTHPQKAGTANRTSHFGTIDLAPTLLAIAGVAAPAGTAFDGVPLRDTLLGRSETSRSRPLFFRRPPDRAAFAGDEKLPDLAVREGRWKLLCTYAGSTPQLYDLAADPSEKNNLAAAHPGETARLVAAVVAWHRSLPADTGATYHPRATKKKS